MKTRGYAGLVCLVAAGCSTPTITEPGIIGLDPQPQDRIPISTLEANQLNAVTARRSDEFVNTIGVNVHLSYFQSPYGKLWASHIKPKLLSLGVRHLRDGGTVVPDDGWMRAVYGRMQELGVNGARFILTMSPALGSTNYNSMSHFDRLLTYALPIVEGFEGLNEHDLSRRSNWVNEVRGFQQALYAAVKNDARTRNLPVLGPPPGHLINVPKYGDLSAYMDYGTMHPYPGGIPSLLALTTHREKVKPLSGTKQLMATESGYHTAVAWNGEHPGVSEQAMSYYTLRLLLNYFNLRVPRVWLYEFIDQGVDQNHREWNFGLLRMNGSEKPAYVALKNMIDILKDPGAGFAPGILSYQVSDVLRVATMLLQKRDGRFYLMLWQEVSSFDLKTKRDLNPGPRSVTITLPVAAGLRVFAPATSPNPIQQSRSNTLVVSVPDHPLIIEITK